MGSDDAPAVNNRHDFIRWINPFVFLFDEGQIGNFDIKVAGDRTVATPLLAMTRAAILQIECFARIDAGAKAIVV